MAINVAGANTYFAPTNHPMARVWAQFSPETKSASIAHAKRILARALNREVDEVASTITSEVREDLATYEQALYTARNSPAVVEGQEGVAGFVSNDQANPDEAARMDPGMLAPEARRYLTRRRPNGMPGAPVEFGRG
jgi:hypothetical protein